MEINPELAKLFGFWGSVLVIKLLIMLPLTARHRFAKKVFASPEDVSFAGRKAKVAYDDPDVERVRRAHLNDLENVLPWFLITYLYLTTGPSVWLAGVLIRTFVLARIAHTISYVILAQQPTRVIAFFIALIPVIYQTAVTFLYYM